MTINQRNRNTHSEKRKILSGVVKAPQRQDSLIVCRRNVDSDHDCSDNEGSEEEKST